VDTSELQPVQATALLQADQSRRKDGAGLQRASGRVHQKAAPARAAIEEDITKQKISQLEARVAELEHRDVNTAASSKKAQHPVYAETCTTKDGESCIFGLDDRDEESHCIPDTDLEYGAFGWCYTKEDKTAWGTCGEMCPFYGPEKVLEEKLGFVQDRLYELLDEVNSMPEKCCGKSKPQEEGKSPKNGGKEEVPHNKAPETDPKGPPKPEAKSPQSDPKGPSEEEEKETAKELLLLMKSRHRAPRKG
jgi:hypothetical protein